MAGPAATFDPDSAAGSAEGTPRTVWVLIATIAAAKLATLLVVLWAARSAEAGGIVAATTWHWLVVAAGLVAGPVLFRLRLRRVRARREQLRRAEWMIAGEPGPVPAIGQPLD